MFIKTTKTTWYCSFSICIELHNIELNQFYQNFEDYDESRCFWFVIFKLSEDFFFQESGCYYFLNERNSSKKTNK